jgi:ABC-2 type transport system permease protein
MSIWQNIINVARRELRIIRNRPLYLMGSVGVILFCAIFYLTLMKDGLPNDIPIGVVDQDNSTTSRNFYQQLDATQLGKVVHYDTYEEARRDMMSGKILALCVIPTGMNDDIQANRQPKITFYTNGLYFVGGALAWKDLLMMVNLTNGAVQREALRMRGYNEDQIMGLIQPVQIDFHQIGMLPRTTTIISRTSCFQA